MAEIEMHEGVSTPQRREAMSDGIHQAMIEVLGIPADDRFHVFHELSPSQFRHDDVVFGKPRDERFMLLTLSFNQRTPEQKNQLYAALAHRLGEHADVRPEDLLIRIIETAKENWWADGRVVDPETGYDQRMTPDTVTR